MATVVQTDYAWPDVAIERAVIEGAGHRLVAGPSAPGTAREIERLVEAHDPEAIMTCWAPVSATAIAAPSGLAIVQRLGVGLDNIDVAAATARGAWVANVPDYCIGEVSDHAVALLLCWARGVAIFDRAVKSGQWDPSPARLRRVADLSVGVVGLGRIGRVTAGKLKALGCSVFASDPTPTTSSGVRILPLEQVLAESDVVILHAPLNAQTQHMINARTLATMRDGAFLINVSRGALVDTDALLHALSSGKLQGAALDVIEGEPEVPAALVERSDVIVTPHIAFSSEASLIDLRRMAAEEVVRALAGDRLRNPCNQPGGPT